MRKRVFTSEIVNTYPPDGAPVVTASPITLPTNYSEMYNCAVYADNHVYIIGKQTYKISLQNNTVEVIAQMFNFLSEGPISCNC